jgi:hypothetical protein
MLQEQFPNKMRVVDYRRAHVVRSDRVQWLIRQERFAVNSRRDGLVERVTRYSDDAGVVVADITEIFKNRMYVCRVQSAVYVVVDDDCVTAVAVIS